MCTCPEYRKEKGLRHGHRLCGVIFHVPFHCFCLSLSSDCTCLRAKTFLKKKSLRSPAQPKGLNPVSYLSLSLTQGTSFLLLQSPAILSSLPMYYPLVQNLPSSPCPRWPLAYAPPSEARPRRGWVLLRGPDHTCAFPSSDSSLAWTGVMAVPFSLLSTLLRARGMPASFASSKHTPAGHLHSANMQTEAQYSVPWYRKGWGVQSSASPSTAPPRGHLLPKMLI